MPETLVIIPDKEIDQQDRLSGFLAGNWGDGVAHTSGEEKDTKEHRRIGFQSPAELKEIATLFKDLHAFLNPGKPEGIVASEDQPQTI